MDPFNKTYTITYKKNYLDSEQWIAERPGKLNPDYRKTKTSTSKIKGILKDIVTYQELKNKFPEKEELAHKFWIKTQLSPFDDFVPEQLIRVFEVSKENYFNTETREWILPWPFRAYEGKIYIPWSPAISLSREYNVKWDSPTVEARGGKKKKIKKNLRKKSRKKLRKKLRKKKTRKR